MSDANKKTLKDFGKAVWVLLIAMVIIITNVEIWNVYAAGATDVFHVVISVINVIWEAIVSVLFFKKAVFKKEE